MAASSRLPRSIVRAGLLGAMLSACTTLEPAYLRPGAPVPPNFPSGAPYPAVQPAGANAGDLGWRAFFTDPKLQTVIAAALADNRDLRAGIAAIEQARQQYRAQRANLFPTVEGSANATYEHIGSGSAGVVASGPRVSGGDAFLRLYSASLGVSAYELDLWGRQRSLSKQAFEQYLASVQARRVTQISVVAEVATAYLTLAADVQRLDVARRTLEGDQASYDLALARFHAGVASELDVRQAQTPLEAARSDVASYTTRGAQDVNALNLLVGAQVIDALLPSGLDDERLLTLADLPAGLSSAVLLTRPDVLQAEHQLKAYNADIGAARAAFFPTLSLTASGGVTSFGLANLFSAGSGTWTLSPNVTLPIFDAGRNLANLRYVRAQRDVALARYEQAIQTGFREVADALAQRGTVSELLAAQQSLVEASAAALRLSQARYQRGVDSYLNTLTAQLNLYGAQQSLISARLVRSTNLVMLYRALGGGLDDPDPAASTAAPSGGGGREKSRPTA